MNYQPDSNRYESMIYNRVGSSGLKLPAVSLGLWHNFGDVDPFSVGRDIVFRAFDLGITHFDLANNYGPPPGSAEKNFGRIFKEDLKSYRDELVISSKAGYDMWPGPYGNWGSRKYLVASLDQSLQRLGLDYVDIFYHHRPDPDTPLEETMGALDHIVRQGKALYVGLSNYPADKTQTAIEILKNQGTPFIIHQPRYNMFDRWIEQGLTEVLKKNKIGCIVFSPLFQGLLTDKYLERIPENSRVAKSHGFLKKDHITEERTEKVRKLNEIAGSRNQSMAQLALAWVLRESVVSSVLVGASSVNQLEENVKTLDNLNFSNEELKRINQILS